MNSTETCNKQVQTGYLEKFDPDVLLLAKSDECPKELLLFSAIEKISKQTIYLKTKFHLEFSTTIQCFHKEDLAEKKLILSGIEGLGKTTSALYYVLQCLKNGNNKVHYIDIERFVGRQDSFEIFDPICSKFGNDYFLIIDHVTVSNRNIVKRIEDKIYSKGFFDIKLLCIEAGFSASGREAFLSFDKRFQLCEKEFVAIWNEIYAHKSRSLDDTLLHRLVDVEKDGKVVYKMFSVEFVTTPRLICSVFIAMLVKRRTLVQAFDAYDQEQRDAIRNFTKLSDCSMERFRMHTRLLLYCIAEKGNLIVTKEQRKLMLIAINIFHCEEFMVTEDHLKNFVVFTEHGLEAGDTAYKLTHLIARFADYWREELPFNLADISSYTRLATYPEILNILFQCGILKKEIEVQLVRFQKDKRLVILPVDVSETKCWISDSGKCKISHADWGISDISLSREHYYYIKNDITSVDIDDLHVEVSGHFINVAKCAVWIKRHVDRDSDTGFLLYPQIEDFLGIDYFVYKPHKHKNEGHEKEACPFAKLFKGSSTLMCVQVATGAKHYGSTLAKALNIVKKIVDSPDIIVHVAVIVAVGEKHGSQYTLTGKYNFSNISVINLNSTLSEMFRTQPLLHTLVSECIKFNSF